MNSFLWFLIVVFTGLYFDVMNIFKLSILSSILHESGHIVAYRFFTGQWPDIGISVFGFTMKNNVSYNKYYPFILIAGPFVNLICTLVSLLVFYNKSNFNVLIFALVNSIVFIFNMLPVYFLDGGQLLYSLLPVYQQNWSKISIFSVIVSFVMLIYFTGVYLPFFIFSAYFIVNILNDI